MPPVFDKYDSNGDRGRLIDLPVIFFDLLSVTNLQIMNALHSICDCEERLPECLDFGWEHGRQDLFEVYSKVHLSVFQQYIACYDVIVGSYCANVCLFARMMLNVLVICKPSNHAFVFFQAKECIHLVFEERRVNVSKGLQSKLISLKYG